MHLQRKIYYFAKNKALVENIPLFNVVVSKISEIWILKSVVKTDWKYKDIDGEVSIYPSELLLMKKWQ